MTTPLNPSAPFGAFADEFGVHSSRRLASSTRSPWPLFLITRKPLGWVFGYGSPVRLDAREHKANNPEWTGGIASPTIPSLWSGSPAACARAAAPIASPDWPRNTDRRSAFGTLRTVSHTIASGGPRRGLAAVICAPFNTPSIVEPPRKVRPAILAASR
jgi:hypothetical protein